MPAQVYMLSRYVRSTEDGSMVAAGSSVDAFLQESRALSGRITDLAASEASLKARLQDMMQAESEMAATIREKSAACVGCLILRTWACSVVCGAMACLACAASGAGCHRLSLRTPSCVRA